MDFLPLHFNLSGQIVLVVGAGRVALRKVELLLQAGADIRLVAPEIDDELRSLLAGEHSIIEATYDKQSLEGVALAVAATADEHVNRQVSEDAQRQMIPVNVVDQPALCTVVFPAIIDRSPLLVSVGSGGASPVLVRHIRELLEHVLPESLASLASYLKSRRGWLKQALPDVVVRRRATEKFLSSPGKEFASQGQSEAADAYLKVEGSPVSGEVYVVGGGPGDPDLLTLRALQLMQQADIILYDNLVTDAVLARARRDARRQFVGKRSGHRSITQEDINQQLISLARQGNRVLRLKGGDPFIFGRGGEETQALVEAGVPFQVVPGITAASGCAAYAGIPLTHRDHSQSVRFVTGRPSDGAIDLPWQELVTPNQTVVFYMGLSALSVICQQLIQHGLDADMPIAIVSKGTTTEQKVICGNLETITGLAARLQIESPTLIIVGMVVGLYRASHSS